MSNGLQAIGTEALRVWGALGLVAFFLVGAYFYLDRQADRTERTIEKERQVAEARDLRAHDLIRKQQELLGQSLTGALNRLERRTNQMSERSKAFTPVINRLERFLASQAPNPPGTIAQPIP